MLQPLLRIKSSKMWKVGIGFYCRAPPTSLCGAETANTPHIFARALQRPPSQAPHHLVPGASTMHDQITSKSSGQISWENSLGKSSSESPRTSGAASYYSWRLENL